jgi:hypothetical protein
MSRAPRPRLVTVGAGESPAELVRVIPGAIHHRRARHKAVLFFRYDLEVVRIGEEAGDVVDALKWMAVRSDEMSEGGERASVCRTSTTNDQPGRGSSVFPPVGGAHDEGESGDPVRRAPGDLAAFRAAAARLIAFRICGYVS